MAAAKENCPPPKTTLLPLLEVRPWSLGWFWWFWELILRVFFGVTVTQSLQWHEGEWVCLFDCWFIAKNQAGGTLNSAVTGIWRSCIRCLSALPASVDTKQEPREPINGFCDNSTCNVVAFSHHLSYGGMLALWGCGVHCLGRSRWGN